MSTTYHTPIATGAPANASTINTPLGQLDAAVVDLVAGYPKRGQHFHHMSTVTVGNAITISTAAAHAYNHVAFQSPGADGDTFTFGLTLAAGTYTLGALGITYTNRGILDWYLDDVLIGAGQDWYNGTTGNNITKTVSSIVIATSGWHVFKGVVNDKNVSSSGYAIALTALWVKQAAD